MKELLRIEQGNLESWLQQYCLTIYQGDVMYIQSISDRSLSCLREVLSGERPMDSGKLYLEERWMEKYDSVEARKWGIYTVAFGREFVENLSIAENLYSVQPAWRLYSREKTLEMVGNYLKQEELVLDPQVPVWKLTDAEKKKLGILKAKLLGARLIILDMMGSGVEGRMAEEIGSMVQRLNRQGMTFLILASAYHEISEVATRAQFLYSGRDVKEWTPVTEACREKLRNGSFCMFAGQQEEEGQFSGQHEELSGEKRFLGLYDYEWDVSGGIWNYLETVKEQNPEIWRKYVKADIPDRGDAKAERTVVIPRDSRDLLLDNLSVTENLTIAAAGRVSRRRYGKTDPKLEQLLVQDFYREIRLDPSIQRVEELNRIQKKILSIARWSVTRPETILLESPYSDLNPVEVLLLRGYLKRLAGKGIRIIYFAKSLENMFLDCKMIIRTQNGLGAKIDTF